MREIVQFCVSWYKPGAEMVVDDDKGLYTTETGERLTELSAYTRSKTQQTYHPANELVEAVLFQPGEIVIKPFVEITPIGYMSSERFVGMEEEVDNRSTADVFGDHLDLILKLANKTGHKLKKNTWGHSGDENTIIEIVTTVWYWQWIHDDDGGESDFGLVGSAIFNDFFDNNSLLLVEKVKDCAVVVPINTLKPITASLGEL